MLLREAVGERRRGEGNVSWQELYQGKLAWGIILACVFLVLVFSFVRNAIRTRQAGYRWFRVFLMFAVIGLAMYVVFVVQP